MKESNFLTDRASIKQLQREVWLNTKGQLIKESNSLEDIITRNLLKGQVSQGTKRRNFFLQVIVQFDKKYIKIDEVQLSPNPRKMLLLFLLWFLVLLFLLLIQKPRFKNWSK